MAGSVPLVYADACLFVEVLQKKSATWRDSYKVLGAAERRDIRFVAFRLLAVEVGRFRADRQRERVDDLVMRYLDAVDTRWVEVDLLISREARNLSWEYNIKSGADAVHLSTAVRQKADYFMSRDGAFPYGETIGQTRVVYPQVIWEETLFDEDDLAGDPTVES